ncbi:hypothetical protein F5878DRAFT_257152 [Lentinula raphanica]|uniref:Uncharacterized protein n=1 Tax=Lentinula raphanica TaxID=153919 RepID=A0AA38PIK3_9AGAR|nr:hypothetical protein F5878DRAFT_257152 [Lentinula raphanica]
MHAVFDLSNLEEIDKILNLEFNLNTIAIFDHKRGIETGKLERELYQPFITVAHDLVAPYLAEKCPGETCSLRLHKTHGDPRLSNPYTRRSPAVGPNVVSLWTSSDDSIDLAAVQSPFVFKAKKTSQTCGCGGRTFFHRWSVLGVSYSCTETTQLAVFLPSTDQLGPKPSSYEFSAYGQDKNKATARDVHHS